MARRFGGLLETAIAQLGVVREVVVEKGKAGKLQLDLALINRRRRAALQKVGERVLALAESGRLEVDEHADLADALDDVRALDDELARAAEASGGGGADFFAGAVSAFAGRDPFARGGGGRADVEDLGDDDDADLAPPRPGDEGHVVASKAWESIARRAAKDADDAVDADDDDEET